MFYNDLPKEKVLRIHTFVMRKRKEFGLGQRKLCRLVKENFDIRISEGTVAGWIFRDLVPFANEKTQFRAKAIPLKKVIFNLYFEQEMSPDEIGKKYSVTGNTVRAWIKCYGGKTRSLKESMGQARTKRLLRAKKLRMPAKSFDKLTPEKSYILGVLCGDGHINSKFIRFEIRKDEEFIKEFVMALKNVYGLAFQYKYYSPRNSYVLYAHAEIIVNDLLRYGKFAVNSWHVPIEVMGSDDEKIIGMYVRGMFDSEGSVGKSAITISSICKNGLEQIKILLGKLGIKSLVRPVRNGQYFVLYIFRKQRFKIFRDKVGFTIERKQEKLNDILKNDRFHKEA